MRRRIISIILTIILFILSSCSCSDKYVGWQQIYIPNVGHIKVPGEWVIEIDENGYIYMTDKPRSEEGDFEIYLIDVNVLRKKDQNINQTYEIKTIESAVLSNGAVYGLEEWNVEGDLKEIRFLSISGFQEVGVRLVSWDCLVKEEIIYTIAQSFVGE